MTDLASVSNLKRFKALIDKFKQLDIVTKELTLFDVGARGHFENPTTELLSFFLDTAKAHNLGECFFKGLKSLLEGKNKMATLGSLESVETEVSTMIGQRIDLLLETDNEIIIVECKIYHDQNNPFEDYSQYGDQRRRKFNSEKQLIRLVLCLDGSISNDLKASGWYGISYFELTQSIEPHLAEVLLDNPYNKWGLFAREFLLHLKELDNVGDINENEVNFLNENFKEFTKLSAYIYEDLMPKIGAKIERDLNGSGLADFICKQKSGKWNYYEPIRRFSNMNWTTQSDILLCIRAYDETVSHHINLHIGNQSEELVAKFKSLLSNYFPTNYSKTWFEINNTFWGVSWEFNNFNIEEISKNVIELMRCLNELELDYRPSISE